jgi:carbamoyltransferase
MKFLGISPAHDSSVCLLEDGKIVKFYKEERLTRIKRDSYPIKSLIKALDAIDCVEQVAYAPPQEGSWNNFFEDWKVITKKFTNPLSFKDLSRDHHKVHAALAFYNSGFSEAAVLVVDGAGSRIGDMVEQESIFYASYPDNFIPVYKNLENLNPANKTIPEELINILDCEIVSRESFGIVMAYCSATTLIGESPLENGKTMGLSAYGKGSRLPNLFLDGTPLVDRSLFFEDNEKIPVYKDNLLMSTNSVTEEGHEFYSNYAYHVQRQTEAAMLLLIEKCIQKTGSKNICVTGGYALNVVANKKYLEYFPGVNFYFEPIADDSGNSIGAAMLSYRSLTKDKKINKLNNTFFHGEKYSLNSVHPLAKEFNTEQVSDLLINQKSVAVFYDLAEAGPRALGNRSILFDARNPEAKRLVNIIKKREWYRPFAAICLPEDAHKYFDVKINDGYEFMTINADANDMARDVIPGVLHVDGTCRIQILKNTHEPVYKILKEFKDKTGVGVLLNTSFNLAGEALVETPEDALNTYLRTKLDCLWFPEISKAIVKL